MIPFSAMIIESESAQPKGPAPDEGLIREIAGGSKDALAQLYRETDAAVYGFALSFLKNKYDAEDVMQETYLRIYAGAASYRPGGKPMAWILTIAKNCALAKLRTAKRQPVVSPEDAELWRVEDPRQTREDQLVLEAAMTRLSDEERQIVVLYSAAGLKHREIAELLQIPLSTVLSKYRRAILKLRNFIKEEELQ